MESWDFRYRYLIAFIDIYSAIRPDHSVNMKDISPEGKKLIQARREIVNTAREKNADELFQYWYFVWHTQNVDTDSLK